MTKHIVVIVDRFPQPSETFVVDHLQGLLRQGWDVTVLCDGASREASMALGSHFEQRLHVEELSSPRPRRWARVRRAAALALRHPSLMRPLLRSPALRATLCRVPTYAQALSELHPAMIHAHFGHNGVLAALAARAGIPIVVDFHGHDVNVLTRQEHWWSVYRALLARCHGIVHSDFMFQRVGAQLGIPLHQVRLGVDLERFAPKVLRWEGAIRCLAVGRLVLQKGHHIAIEALAKVARAYPAQRVELRIVGAGPMHDGLLRLARELGVSDRVDFAGALPHEEVAREMTQAHLLLVPSLRMPSGAEEAFGRVALEGLAAGLPVIGTATGGLQEILRAGGWIVEPGSAGALAEAVHELVSEPHPADWARRARAVAERYSNERMWEEYDAVAEQVSTRS